MSSVSVAVKKSQVGIETDVLSSLCPNLYAVMMFSVTRPLLIEWSHRCRRHIDLVLEFLFAEVWFGASINIILFQGLMLSQSYKYTSK